MRRSSAPSVLSKAKKPRFATPWVKEKDSITTEALNVRLVAMCYHMAGSICSPAHCYVTVDYNICC